MEKTQLNRGQFLRQLGLSTGALMAFYCMGTSLTACSGSGNDTDPTPNPGGGNGNTNSAAIKGTTSGANIDFTIDLTHADFSKLKTAGQFDYVANIIIVNTGGTYVALSKVCTHQGTTISYRSANNDLRCSNHGSEFNLDGSVKVSPATEALAVYKTEIQNNGNTLRVSA